MAIFSTMFPRGQSCSADYFQKHSLCGRTIGTAIVSGRNGEGHIVSLSSGRHRNLRLELWLGVRIRAIGTGADVDDGDFSGAGVRGQLFDIGAARESITGTISVARAMTAADPTDKRLGVRKSVDRRRRHRINIYD